jgi:hypothetical protein
MIELSWAPVDHICNSSYSGGTDKEEHGYSQLGQTVPENYLKKTDHKKELVEWLKVQAPSSNSSTSKKKKRLN